MIHGARILFLYWKTGHFSGIALLSTCKNWTGDRSVPSRSVYCVPGSVLNVISFSQQLYYPPFIPGVTDTYKG